MLRIVKMEFNPQDVSEFLDMFAEKKELIRNSPGCRGLRLLQDKNTENIFFTYSKWDKEEDLNNYRASELFKSTWALTKTWFSAKPAAWSVEIKEDLF